MGLSIQLADGQSVIAYEDASGVWFELANEASGTLGSPVKSASVNATWIGLKANADGGFSLAYAFGGALYQSDYDARGAVLAGPRPVSAWTAPPAALAFTSLEDALPGQLPNGDMVVTTTTSAPDGQAFTVQLEDPNGAPIGAPYVQPLQHLSSDTPFAVTPLATGGYALFWRHDGALLPAPSRSVILFDAHGQKVGSTVSLPGLGGFPDHPIAGLADGGFATLTSDYSSGTLYLSEYAADGSVAAAPVALGQGSFADAQIVAFADGRYEVVWNGQHRMFTEARPALGAVDPAPTQSTPTSGTFTPAGSPVTLSASAGWTSAAVLSNGTLAIVAAQDGGYGSHVATEQTYDGSGAEIASAALMGYAGAGQMLKPQVTALAAGYYQVSYAGSSDYEVYNGADHRVFVHNAYTSATAALTPLLNGGYVMTDVGSNTLAVFDANGSPISWKGLPPDAAGAPSVLALDGGGFALTYARSSHFDIYDASGALQTYGDLSASTSEFATAVAPLAGGGFAKAWLSYDGGQYGFATALDFQAVGPHGPLAPAVTLVQDLDPWHTQFALQSHADGSVAILWSRGGAAFGAEYGAGGDLTVRSTGVAEGLSDMRVIELPGDKVGLAWVQGGDAWAEIFDPASGSVTRQDLGAASGDVSTVHALATAAGGIAVSWHSGTAVVGSVLEPDGQVTPAQALPGDLLGVDSQGHALTLHDSGGTPVLQAYALSDGLFWTG